MFANEIDVSLVLMRQRSAASLRRQLSGVGLPPPRPPPSVPASSLSIYISPLSGIPTNQQSGKKVPLPPPPPPPGRAGNPTGRLNGSDIQSPMSFLLGRRNCLHRGPRDANAVRRSNVARLPLHARHAGRQTLRRERERRRPKESSS